MSNTSRSLILRVILPCLSFLGFFFLLFLSFLRFWIRSGSHLMQLNISASLAVVVVCFRAISTWAECALRTVSGMLKASVAFQSSLLSGWNLCCSFNLSGSRVLTLPHRVMRSVVCSRCSRAISHSGLFILSMNTSSSSGDCRSICIAFTDSNTRSVSPKSPRPSSVSMMIMSANACGTVSSRNPSSSIVMIGVRPFGSCGSLYSFNLDECMGMDFPSPNSRFTSQVSLFSRSAITYPDAYLACSLVARPPLAGVMARKIFTLSPISNSIPARELAYFCCLYSISNLCC